MLSETKTVGTSVEPRSLPHRELAFFGDALVELTQVGVLVEVERHLLPGPAGEMDGICQPYPVDAFCTGRDEGGTIEDVGGEILQHTRVFATPTESNSMTSDAEKMPLSSWPVRTRCTSSGLISLLISRSGLVSRVITAVVLFSTTILPLSPRISNRSVPTRS